MAVVGSRIDVSVRSAARLNPLAGVTVAVSPQVFLTADMSGSPVSSVVSNGMGEVVCYALPGTYSFTASGAVAIPDQVVTDTLGGGLSVSDEGVLTALIGGKLAKASNLSDVADVPTARVNLGLGSAATQPSTAFDAAGAAAAAQAAAILAAAADATTKANNAQTVAEGYTDTSVAALVNSAPATLDTLKELADALGDDANYAATVTAALALKAPLDSPALTDIPTAPTAVPGTDTDQIASTAFVGAGIAVETARAEAVEALFAPVLVAPKPTGVTGGDDTVLQAFLDSITGPCRVVWPYLAAGSTYSLSGTGLVMPAQSGVHMSGAGMVATRIVQTSENPIFRNMTQGIHDTVIEEMSLEYATAPDATTTNRNAVTFEDSSTATFYHNTYRLLRVKNAYRGFYIVGTANPPTVWDTTFERVRWEATQHSCIDFTNNRTGSPRVYLRGCGVINTGFGVTSDAPAFVTGGVNGGTEFTVDGLDIESWNGQIVNHYGTYQLDVRNVHIEHHTMDSTASSLFFVDGGNGQTHWVRDVTIQSLTFSAGAATEQDIVMAGTSGTGCRVKVDGVKVGTVTNTAGVTIWNLLRLGGASAGNQTGVVGSVADATGLGILKVPCSSTHTTALQQTDLEPGVVNTNLGTGSGVISTSAAGDNNGSPVSGTQYMNKTGRPVTITVSSGIGVTNITVGASGAGTSIGTFSGQANFSFSLPRGLGYKMTWTGTQPTTKWTLQ